MIGKLLPRFENIKIDFSPKQTKDRTVLVCFWDMQQRPSRRCIIQLAKQAQQLKQEGVVVVTVQASKVDENTLNQWVKNYKIPFPVGMVQGDVEKIRFVWGVCSLPWLILTNRQHVVTAEDFGPNELNEKIMEAVNIKH